MNRGQFLSGLVSKRRCPLGSNPLRGSDWQPARAQRKPTPTKIGKMTAIRLCHRDEITDVAIDPIRHIRCKTQFVRQRIGYNRQKGKKIRVAQDCPQDFCLYNCYNPSESPFSTLQNATLPLDHAFSDNRFVICFRSCDRSDSLDRSRSVFVLYPPQRMA